MLHTIFGFLKAMSSIFGDPNWKILNSCFVAHGKLTMDTFSHHWSLIQQKSDLVQSVVDEAHLVIKVDVPVPDEHMTG